MAARSRGGAVLSAERMSALEIACGVPFGGADVRLPAARADPVDALEAATLPALRAPGRAFVAYSGGRDSALVLAAAVAAARRHGLDDPIPLTVRLPDAPESQEEEWQELTVAHLGLSEWERVTVTDELDILGPVATDILRRHGPYWPANAHFFGLLLGRVAGGTLMTGDGGDDLLVWWRWGHAADLLAGRARRRPRHVATVAAALGPSRVRRWAGGRRVGAEAELPWLTPAAKAEYAGVLARLAEVPWRWDRQLEWMSGRLAVTAATETFELLARDAGASISSPLLDPEFLAALGAAGGATGFGDRTAMLRRAFSGLLPDAVLSRRGKATFGGAFFRGAFRKFADDWTGRGVDSAVVDASALRRTWKADRIHWQSSNLIHSCWLADRA